MKKFLIKITVVASLLLISKNSFSYVNLNSFSIPSQYLIAGGLMYNPNGTARNFSANAVFVQSGTTFNTIKVKLILEINGTETVLATAEKLEGNWTNGTFWDVTLNGTIPAGIWAGRVYLKAQEFQGTTPRGIQQSINAYVLLPSDYTPPSAGIPNAFYRRNSNDEYLYKIERVSTYQTPPAFGTTWAFYPSSTQPMMTKNQVIYSDNGEYQLNFQGDGNLVIYKVGSWNPLWSINKTGGENLWFNPDGNIIMLNASNQIVWKSDIYVPGMSFTSSQRLYMLFQGDGNLAIYWNGVTYTDVVGSSGTGGGIVSNRFGSLKL